MKKIFLLLFIGVQLAVIAKDDTDVKKSKGWKKYTLTVNLTTGQKLELKSRINIDFCNQVMFLYDENENAIYPNNTISIERKLKDGTVITGYPTDSLWLFQSFKGKLSGFSTRPELKLKHVEFLSANGGGLVDFEKETLRSILSENQEALGLYYKSETQRKIAKNIFATSFLVGLAHVYLPSPIKTSSTKEEVMFYPPLAFVGIICAANYQRKSKLNLQKAITVYNK